ncbi:hypothetical protein [Myxosarcina sp. GI1(2024)]
MKPIVANLLIAIFFCGSFANYPALADSQLEKPSRASDAAVSANLLTYDKLPTFFPAVNIYQIISIDKLQAVDFDSFNLITISDWNLRLNQQPFTYQYEKEDLILGFQNTFWSSQNRRYWGVTTVEYLRENRVKKQLNLTQLNYTNEAPLLTPRKAVLTISGGGERNSVNNHSNNFLGKFEDFRGGVTYHQSLSDALTFGIGFVYEDLLQSFSQFTYQSNFLPLRTTVSLLTGDRGLEVHSHLRFKPSNDFVINYYHEREEQKFDLNWAMLSGLSLTAKGNSLQESLSAGLKVAVKSQFFSLFARAELENNQNWNWRLDSQLGSLRLIHAANRLKSQSEIDLNILDSLPNNFGCSLFFKYETRQSGGERETLTVWGGSLHSKLNLENNEYRWKLDLGYGIGSQGNGAIASTSIGLMPNLSLKLIYEEVSALSDDTNIKLQLAQ